MKQPKTQIFFVVMLAMLMGATLFSLASDEGTAQGFLQIVNGTLNFKRVFGSYKFDQSTALMDYGVEAVAIGATNNIPVNNVTTPRYSAFRNNDLTNDIYVTVTMKLRPGDFAILPPATTNITRYVTAGTNNLEYLLLNE